MSRFEEQAAEIMASSWSYPGLMERKAEELLLVFSRNNSLGTWSTWSIFFAQYAVLYSSNRMASAFGQTRANGEFT